MCVCVCACVRACVRARVCVGMSERLQSDRERVQTCTHIHRYTHTHKHTHTHTRTFTHTQAHKHTNTTRTKSWKLNFETYSGEGSPPSLPKLTPSLPPSVLVPPTFPRFSISRLAVYFWVKKCQRKHVAHTQYGTHTVRDTYSTQYTHTVHTHTQYTHTHTHTHTKSLACTLTNSVWLTHIQSPTPALPYTQYHAHILTLIHTYTHTQPRTHMHTITHLTH